MQHIEHHDDYARAVKANILRNARVTFERNTPRHDEIIALLATGLDADGKYRDDFVGAMAQAYDSYGKLTEKQVEAVLRIVDQRAARRAEWADKQAELDAKRVYLGEVGQKVELELVVCKIIRIEGPAFSYYDNGISWLYIFEDRDGNVCTYKGKSSELSNVEEKQHIKLRATVKDHGVYKGTKQTVLQRPKLLT